MKNLMLCSLLAIACGDSVQTVGGDNDPQQVDDGDTDCPLIEHEAVEGSQPVGADVLITATITDESSVTAVALRYRQETSDDWLDITMTKVDPLADDYRAVIPAGHLGSAQMRYYIYAVDAKNNECIAPEGADENPFDAWSFNIATR